MIDRQNFDEAEHNLMRIYGKLCDIYDEIDAERKQYWPKTKAVQEVCDRIFDARFSIQEAIHAICKYHEICDEIDKKDESI